MWRGRQGHAGYLGGQGGVGARLAGQRGFRPLPGLGMGEVMLGAQGSSLFGWRASEKDGVGGVAHPRCMVQCVEKAFGWVSWQERARVCR